MDVGSLRHLVFINYLLIQVTSCFQTLAFYSVSQSHILAEFELSGMDCLFTQAKKHESPFSGTCFSYTPVYYSIDEFSRYSALEYILPSLIFSEVKRMGSALTYLNKDPVGSRNIVIYQLAYTIWAALVTLTHLCICVPQNAFILLYYWGIYISRNI